MEQPRRSAIVEPKRKHTSIFGPAPIWTRKSTGGEAMRPPRCSTRSCAGLPAMSTINDVRSIARRCTPAPGLKILLVVAAMALALGQVLGCASIAAYQASHPYQRFPGRGGGGGGTGG